MMLLVDDDGRPLFTHCTRRSKPNAEGKTGRHSLPVHVALDALGRVIYDADGSPRMFAGERACVRCGASSLRINQEYVPCVPR